MNRNGRKARRPGEPEFTGESGFADESGFTLIEIMIVVAIIGILAAVAMPKFALMIERSREATTKSAVASIRSAIALYFTQQGEYPAVIEADPESEFSRYLEALPPVKASHSGVGSGQAESPSGTMVLYTTDENITAAGKGWRYSPKTGRVFVNSSVTDSKGFPYSTYGY